MEILGIGMSELIFIVVIALIVLGPKDMQKAGKTIGRWLRSIVTSDGWKAFQQTSRELRTLPNRLMREANEEINKIGSDIEKDISASGTARGRYDTLKSPQRSRPVAPTSPVPMPPLDEVSTTPPSPDNEAPATEGDPNTEASEKDA